MPIGLKKLFNIIKEVYVVKGFDLRWNETTSFKIKKQEPYSCFLFLTQVLIHSKNSYVKNLIE